MVLRFFYPKDAAQIGNVPQRPDDDIVGAIYKAMASIFERRVVDPAIGNGAPKNRPHRILAEARRNGWRNRDPSLFDFGRRRDIKRQYRQVAQRVTQQRIDQENPAGRCGEGGRFDLVIVIRVVHSRLAGRNTGASRRLDN